VSLSCLNPHPVFRVAPVDVLKSHHDRNVPLPVVVLCKVCTFPHSHRTLTVTGQSACADQNCVILENVSQTCTTVSS